MQAHLDASEEVDDGVVDDGAEGSQDGHEDGPDGAEEGCDGDDEPEADDLVCADVTDEGVGFVPDSGGVHSDVEQDDGEEPGDESDEGHG